MKLSTLFFVFLFSLSAKAFECESWVVVDSDDGQSILRIKEPMEDVRGDQSNYVRTYIKEGVDVRLDVQQDSGRVTVQIYYNRNLVLNSQTHITRYLGYNSLSLDIASEGHGISSLVVLSCL